MAGQAGGSVLSVRGSLSASKSVVGGYGASQGRFSVFRCFCGAAVDRRVVNDESQTHVLVRFVAVISRMRKTVCMCA